MLYLPDIIEHSKFVFKTSVQTEMQGEDEIVFQDEGYKRPSFATRASSGGLTNRASTEVGEGNKNEAQDVTLTQIESTQSNVFDEKKQDIFNQIQINDFRIKKDKAEPESQAEAH